MTTTEALTPDQVAQYERDGFLIVPDLLSASEAEAFVDHASATDTGEWRESLRYHAADASWNAVATNARVVAIVKQLFHTGETPNIVQTMYMVRPPAGDAPVGGKGIALHQDQHYLPTDPAEMIACWIAMEDTDPGNGGLCVVPGSHTEGLLHTHKNDDDEEHDSWETDHLMRDRDGREWTQSFYSFDIEGLDEGAITCLTIPRGAGVFFSGHTIHGSYGNRSKDRIRRAFATHYVPPHAWVSRADVQDVVPAA